MNTVDYVHMLPNSRCSTEDAIEALIERVPRCMNEGLFKIDNFVQVFTTSIDSIINNLPDDPDERKEIEIELAYIIHSLYINEDLIISRDSDSRNIRSVELVLDKQGLLVQYLSFASGVQNSVNISEPKYFLQFLDYLASYIRNGIRDVGLYLQSCIRISQFGDAGVDILLKHLRKKFSYISMDDIDDMIDKNNGYLGKGFGDANERIHCIMKEENVSHDEATILFRDFQKYFAGLHFYLTGLYGLYTQTKLFTIKAEEQSEILALFNDFHDIIDPKYFVPFFLENGNMPENPEREKMKVGGRVLH